MQRNTGTCVNTINSSQQWVNADVHSWSKQMSEILRNEMPQLVQESEAAANTGNVAEIKALLPQSNWCVIDKIHGRRNMKDGDLCNTNPFGLLQIAWNETSKTPEGFRALSDLLSDIAGTCLQGDTHRLFFYIRAIRVSKLSV